MKREALEILEFHKVLNMASSHAMTAGGKAMVHALRPLREKDKALERMEILSECKRLFDLKGTIVAEAMDSLSAAFRRLKPEDAVLEPMELREFLPLFDSALALKKLAKDPEYPRLGNLLKGLHTHPALKRTIETSIDLDGGIMDGASPELTALRKAIRGIEGRIKKTLEGILNRKDLAPHLQDFYSTERKGRWVVPVKKNSRGHLAGVLQDISNTGETLFIEPFEVQSLCNGLDSLKAEEKLEEYRILKDLSAQLRQHLPDIKEDYAIVVRYDALAALAIFSSLMNMSPPELNEKGYIRIYQGRHPILWRTFLRLKEGKEAGQEERELVPLDFELGRAHRCMVITGSNTGGKTVALKTVGILHLMALCGMHVPATEGTTLPFLKKILVDIGDEQSIEASLSTFSAHITHIGQILRQCGPDTLVLIDELGTGTDPDEGGGLACAILKEIRDCGALGAVTTHLKAPKIFAFRQTGFINASMEMDTVDKAGESLRPSYKLTIGVPGSSHAFAIAARFGIPQKIIDEAKTYMDSENMALELMIGELHKKTDEYGQKIHQIERLQAELTEKTLAKQEEINRIRQRRKESLAKAYTKAEDILTKAKADAAIALEETRKRDAASARQAVVNIDKKLARARDKRIVLSRAKATPLPQEPKPGMEVLVRGFNVAGTVLSVNHGKGRCTVAVRGREVEVPLTELAGLPSKETEPPGKVLKESLQRAGITMDTALERGVSMEIKLIGMRVDPALSLLERYLNDAAMEGLPQVRLIHGIGTGILASAVREFLASHPLVKKFKKGSDDEGGEAVTIVELNTT